MQTSERFDRLDTMIAEGRIVRNTWTEGEERACLLAAISPECGEQHSPEYCPASVLPRWFAHLTPSMDDNGTLETWPGFVRRYARVVRRAASTLDAKAWQRAEYRVRALGCLEAMKHTTYEPSIKACEQSAMLCAAVAEGGEINPDRFKAARSAASAARSAASAAYSAASAAYSAASAASAAYSAASAARSAAYSAASAASAAYSAADSAASAAYSAASAARSAAYSAAWDRLNDAILDALEFECNRVEASA